MATGQQTLGAGSNCDELLKRAETYLNINEADGRGSALLVMELADALRSALTVRPSDAPVPQVREALTEPRFQALRKRLLHAITTASNDDISEPMSEKRLRHTERVAAMYVAIDFIDAALTARPSDAAVAWALAWLPIETAPEHVQHFARNCMTDDSRNDYIEFCGTLVDGRPFVLCLKEPYGKEYDRWLPLPRVETKGDAVLAAARTRDCAVMTPQAPELLP